MMRLWNVRLPKLIINYYDLQVPLHYLVLSRNPWNFGVTLRAVGIRATPSTGAPGAGPRQPCRHPAAVR
jgi:hypothetical protein